MGRKNGRVVRLAGLGYATRCKKCRRRVLLHAMCSYIHRERFQIGKCCGVVYYSGPDLTHEDAGQYSRHIPV